MMINTIFKICLFLILINLSNPLAAEEVQKRECIVVGDELSEVVSVLKESGAKDISSVVGITTTKKSLWYELTDSTCVHLLFEKTEDEEKYKLCTIYTGEQGKGYGGKLVWNEQNVKDKDKLWVVINK